MCILISDQNSQEYDVTLKALFGNHAEKIIPRLLPGTEFVGEKNIELDRSMIRVDLVYNVLQNGRQHILNLELQTDSGKKMPLRVLQYHALLHVKYEDPVLSVLLYPFKTRVPISPYIEKSGEKILLELHFEVIALWLEDAREYVREQAVYMYTFLPVMKNADADLLIQAIHEMERYYSREDLRHHLGRFYRLLQRSNMVSKQDKQAVKEELFMQYGRDWLIETMPEVKRIAAKRERKGKKEGKREGKKEGELLTSRLTVLEAMQAKNPSLLSLAQERAKAMTKPALLRKLAFDILLAPDDDALYKLLKSDKLH